MGIFLFYCTAWNLHQVNNYGIIHSRTFLQIKVKSTGQPTLLVTVAIDESYRKITLSVLPPTRFI